MEDEHIDEMNDELDSMDESEFIKAKRVVVSEEETMSEENPVVDYKSLYEEEVKKRQYLAADFQNYKRRAENELNRTVTAKTDEVIRNFISLYDDFERGIKANPSDTVLPLLMVSFNNILKRFNVVMMDTSVGSKFDVNYHMAISTVKSDKVNPGCIVETYRPGYMVGNRIIRFAEVVVAAE